ncbi:MAG: hypothetical protein KIT20_10010 [Alphaproteobacteria bacterium]|nr:hypothetical protein [Alphaproteobacteria bacterium]
MGGRPQAYAVRVGGQGHYGASEAGALDLARQPDGALERSANIGCMQLQIASHARAFDPPEKIADPALNMRHAAALLMRVRARARIGALLGAAIAVATSARRRAHSRSGIICAFFPAPRRR